ncbi:hypothetical protein BO71DRAFT_315093 [Aspergillus ellipticus CBS 707.79]|uniref:Protein kinase domain-containing protein n=1 Tax=Aspergillus ellipticus CBS 707.79 TaxID=1448320 RepID=A0A319EDV0_9EURO|nr:hypothetical protein BO71DRAFT_315093 [Aspergillus ellipticus CBS 707.79]
MTTTKKKSYRETVLPEDLRNITGHQSTSRKLDTREHTKYLKGHLGSSHRFGIPIHPHRRCDSTDVKEETDTKIKYHKSYYVDQAGSGVIALRDVGEFPTFLVKQRRIPEAWTFRKACHDNLVSLLDFYTESNSIFLAYEYIHLAISLDCLAGIVDMSEADIATVCRKILNSLVYIHSELRISHGSIDCSNILLNEKGEVKLANIGDSMIHEIALSDWKEDIAAIGFIVICMNNNTSLISGAALEDTTLSRSALKFVGNTKEKTAKELLDDEFLCLANPGGSWSLKRHYFDVLPLSIRFGKRARERS